LVFAQQPVNYDGHLLIYSETHVDVIDCFTGDWVQTLNLKRCLPLNHNGLLSASFATEQPYVVYLRNINKGINQDALDRSSST
jgi:serine/threonine-protein kinase MRCK